MPENLRDFNLSESPKYLFMIVTTSTPLKSYSL